MPFRSDQSLPQVSSHKTSPLSLSFLFLILTKYDGGTKRISRFAFVGLVAFVAYLERLRITFTSFPAESTFTSVYVGRRLSWPFCPSSGLPDNNVHAWSNTIPQLHRANILFSSLNVSPNFVRKWRKSWRAQENSSRWVILPPRTSFLQ